MTKKCKVAITGASGFIGRYVIDELIKHSVSVVALVKEPNSIDSFESNTVQIVKFDIHDVREGVYDKVRDVDALIHLAWNGLPNYKSLHHIEQELPAHYIFLKNMINNGLKSLFVSGTCFEYGMQSGRLSEDMCAKPSNPYGYSKRSLYRQLKYLQEVKPFLLTWGRLFYLFGKRQSPNALYSQLLNAVKQKEKVFNMSGGEQLRDYLSVSVVAKYIVDLALQKKDIGIINICSGQPNFG